MDLNPRTATCVPLNAKQPKQGIEAYKAQLTDLKRESKRMHKGSKVMRRIESEIDRQMHRCIEALLFVNL